MLDERFTQPYAPFWNADENTLIFCDCVTGNIYRYVWNEQSLKTGYIEDNIATTFIVPLEGSNNEYAISDVLKVDVIQWNGEDNSNATVVRESFEADDEAY